MTARKEYATSRVGHHVQVLVVVRRLRRSILNVMPNSTGRAPAAQYPALERR